MMQLEHSLYHSVLRVVALSSALTLLFVSGMISPLTRDITLQTEQYVANAVGASAGVAPTELNQITAALTKQQHELEAREAALTERELAIGLSAAESRNWLSGELATWLNSALLFVVLVLMVINYTLDFAYRNRQRAMTPVHNV